MARWKTLSGAKAVGCLPLYIPEEVIHASGMLPVTVWGDEFPDAPPANLPPFICPVARGILSSIRGGSWDEIDGWAFPSTCDTIQNAAEVQAASGDPRPLFPLVFPLSGDLPGAPEYLLDRIEAFVEWTGGVSGRAVSDGALEKSIRVYNEARRLFLRLEEAMADSPGLYSAAEYLLLCRAGAALPRETLADLLRSALARPRVARGGPRAKIFLTGMSAGRDAMEAIDGAGAALVGNDLARCHRYYDGPADEGGDPAVALARRHLGRGACSTLHGPGRSRIETLFGRAAACGADRVLMLRMRACEPETGDLPDLAAEAKAHGIPFLCVDTDLPSSAPGSLKVRIEAFVEMGE